MTSPPLIVHVIYRLDIGGLENGLVNLINRLPAHRYRHVIVCLKDHTDFRQRIQRTDVDVIDLHKREGNDWRMLWRLWKLFRQLRPTIVHSRNLAALEAALPAKLAGVPVCLHGEHGRDMNDLHGQNRRHRWVRRALFPFVEQVIALSKDLESYLLSAIGLPPARIRQIYNGVDTQRFYPSPPSATPALVFGYVGRMQPVKDPLTLVRAFLLLVKRLPPSAPPVSLMMVGDGPLLAQGQQLTVEAQGGAQVQWLGARDDVPELMRQMNVFILPSLAEGISNTILEAMASGLAVIATHVGGNPELVNHDVTGLQVPPSNPEAMAEAMARYVAQPELSIQHGKAARQCAEQQFSLDVMVSTYLTLYDQHVQRGLIAHSPSLSS